MGDEIRDRFGVIGRRCVKRKSWTDSVKRSDGHRETGRVGVQKLDGRREGHRPPSLWRNRRSIWAFLGRETGDDDVRRAAANTVHVSRSPPP